MKLVLLADDGTLYDTRSFFVDLDGYDLTRAIARSDLANEVSDMVEAAISSDDR